jgi:hypothetical protein
MYNGVMAYGVFFFEAASVKANCKLIELKLLHMCDLPSLPYFSYKP